MWNQTHSHTILKAAHTHEWNPFTHTTEKLSHIQLCSYMQLKGSHTASWKPFYINYWKSFSYYKMFEHGGGGFCLTGRWLSNKRISKYRWTRRKKWSGLPDKPASSLNEAAALLNNNILSKPETIRSPSNGTTVRQQPIIVTPSQDTMESHRAMASP